MESKGSNMKNINVNKFVKKFLIHIPALFAAVFASALSAQAYEGKACTAGNKTLKESVKKGNISWLHASDVPGDSEWSSSFLPAEGTPPPKPRNSSPDDMDGGYGHMAYDQWTCMYSAYAARDGKPDTAWSEGVKGPGIGEILIVPIDPLKKARIWIGFGASDAVYKANNRPKKVRLHLFRADESGPTQAGYSYGDMAKIGERVVELKDVNSYQDLPLPSFSRVGTNKNGMSAFVLAIEILEVYRGTKYDDTLISEAGN